MTDLEYMKAKMNPMLLKIAEKLFPLLKKSFKKDGWQKTDDGIYANSGTIDLGLLTDRSKRLLASYLIERFNSEQKDGTRCTTYKFSIMSSSCYFEIEKPYKDKK